MNEYQRFQLQVKEKTSLQFWLLEKEWSQVSRETICSIQAEQAEAGIACYGNGEILCKFGAIRHLPSGTSFLIEPRPSKNQLHFTKKLVRNGERRARVEHTHSSSQLGDPRYHYATKVSNLSVNRIRVIKFAPFGKGILGIKRDPLQGYYSAEQFQSWYSVTDPEGWITQGTTVIDPDNYASGSGVWAYFFEDDLDNRFIATAPLTNA